MSQNGPRAELEARIEAVESGYEFLLAYAAQGRDTDKGAAAGRDVRDYLARMAAALEDLSSVVGACASSVDPKLATVAGAFFAAVDADARVALGAVRLVLARPDIGSQLIDNLNASIHLRALLTDLFVLDEALKPAKPTA
jgi:alkylation response protein AidB-like acyl-CoA dehydrogenase